MIDINKHPIWKGNKLWGGISPIKKRGHLLRLFLAKKYAKALPRELFIGVTGSVGKTTTIAACEEVLKQKFKTLTTSVNLDPILNIPITILKIRPSVKKVILEMGIEYPGEMEFYLSIVRPATGILTRISLAHSEFLGSEEEILREKGKLIEQLPDTGFAILNYDDPLVRKMAEKTKAEVIFYGFDQENCHIWAGKAKIKDFKTIFELNYGVERVEIETNLLGAHQIYSLLAAAALGISNGMSLVSIKKGLEKMQPAEHRLQPLNGFNDSIILDDTHNSSPSALEQAIEMMNLLPARRRIVVLGEMRELGPYSEQKHREIAREIYKNKIDLVFLGGGDAKYIADELDKLGFHPERMQANLQNPQIVSQLLTVLAKGDVVLVKGSRAVRLDEVVKKITKGK